MANEDASKKVADTAAKAEAKIDEIAGKVSSKVDEMIPDNAKNSAKNVASKANEVSTKVDEIADKVDDFADSFLPEQSGTDWTVTAQRSESISRLFIFRLLWIIPQYIIMAVWSIIVLVLAVIYYVLALVSGKRNRRLRNALMRYYRHYYKRWMYIFGMIDARPEIIVK